MQYLKKFEIEPKVIVTIYPDDVHYFEKEEPYEQLVIEVSVFDKSGHVCGTDVLGGVDSHMDIPEIIEAHDMIKQAKNDLKAKLEAIISANK